MWWYFSGFLGSFDGTDSRLLEVCRSKLVELAKAAGIALKQTFAKEGRTPTRHDLPPVSRASKM